jgi:hypothetical protein
MRRERECGLMVKAAKDLAAIKKLALIKMAN